MKHTTTYLLYALILSSIALASSSIYDGGSDTIIIETGGSERLRIDSQGRVGIGTNSPAYDLDVRGRTNISGSLTFNGSSLGGIITNITPEITNISGWWNTGYSNRIQLTFNNSDSDEHLNDFPIMVKINSITFDMNKFQTSGQDIRFVDADGTSLLAHEIEIWNSTHNSFVWVRVPRIDANSSSDYIYMYYNNPSATDGQNATGVWSTDIFYAVWHLSEEDPTTTIYDSTVHGFDGTADLVDADDRVDGFIGKAINFEEGENIKFGNHNFTNNITVEAWAYPTSIPDFSASVVNSKNDWEWAMWFLGSNSDPEFLVDLDTDSLDINLPATTLDGWHHMLGSYKDGPDNTGYFYVNTTRNIDTSAEDVMADGNHNLCIAAECFSGTDDLHFVGTIDEVRIYNDNVSWAWANASFKTMTNSMFTYGSEEKMWWNSSFHGRRKITFNNTNSSENLINFTVLVQLNSSNIDYSKTQNTGQDIRFIDNDDSTIIAHEIETWNESGQSIVWVNVPQIDGNSTTDFIYMYYNNASTDDRQNVSGAWSSDYELVWHMSEDPASSSPQMLDSTNNDVDGTSIGTMTSTDSVNGRFGRAINFDGSDDRIVDNQNKNSYDMETFEFYFSFWVNAGSVSGSFPIHNQNPSGFGVNSYGSVSRFFINEGSGTTFTHASGVQDNTWHLFTGGRNSSHHFVYLDGVLVNTTVDGTLGDVDASTNLSIGAEPDGTGPFAGLLDEIRIVRKSASEDWIYAQYLSQSTQFNTFGEAETLATAGGNETALRFTVGGTEVMRISDNGNVGIGTELPGEKLSVAGAINASGSINALAGVDIAEAFQATEIMGPGDIVSAVSPDDVEKSNLQNAHMSIGVISASPGMTLNNPNLNNVVFVALAGRVPVKVQGTVKAGDYITTSTTAGVGQAALEPSFVVGRAIEDSQNGVVTMLVEPRYFSPQIDQNKELIGGSKVEVRTLNQGVTVNSAGLDSQELENLRNENDQLVTKLQELTENSSVPVNSTSMMEIRNNGIVVVLQ